jgi:hypothetical protein
MENVSLNYDQKTGNLDIIINRVSHNFSGIADKEVGTYLDYVLNLHETGIAPGEAGMKYDMIEDKNYLLSFFMEQQIEKDGKKRMYEKMMEFKKDFDGPIPDEILDEIEELSRIPHMKPEDWLRPFTI